MGSGSSFFPMASNSKKKVESIRTSLATSNRISERNEPFNPHSSSDSQKRLDAVVDFMTEVLSGENRELFENIYFLIVN
jgi:hypothetical protein